MTALSFRSRISLTLLLLALPTAVAVLGWAYSTLRSNSARTPALLIRPVMTSGRQLLAALDTVKLSPAERQALEHHKNVLSDQLALSRQAAFYKSRLVTGLAAALAVLGC